MDKRWAAVWPGWRQRAEEKKKAARKTDVDLAEEISAAVGYGVHRGTVNHWWHGRRTPSLDEFMALCEALGADPAEILFGIKLSYEYVPQNSSVRPALKSAAPTPEYLDAQADKLHKQAERMRRFRAKRRKARLRILGG